MCPDKQKFIQCLTAPDINEVWLCLRQREVAIEVGAREEELGRYSKECSRVIEELSKLHQENDEINRNLCLSSCGLSRTRPMDFLASSEAKITCFLIHFPMFYDIRRLHQPAVSPASHHLRALGSVVYHSRSLSTEVFESV